MQDADARLASLYRRFDNVASVLEELGSVSHTMTDGGRVLKERASSLLLAARQALGYRWKRLEPLPVPDREALRRGVCNDFAAVLIELSATLLPALDGTQSSAVPIELEPVLSRLARLADPSGSNSVVLYASEHLNYSIERHDDPLTALAPQISPGAAPHPLGDPFLFLRIPRVERDSGSLHAIIAGHELGHLRDWAHGLSAIGPPILVPANWVDASGAIKIGYLDHYERFESVASRWAAETVADMIAALTLGPASLQALSELVGTLGAWAIDSVSHPGTDRRAATIVDIIARAGFDQIPDVAAQLVHFEGESVNALTRDVRIEDSPYPEADTAAWEFVRAKLGDLEAATRGVVSIDERITPAEWPLVVAAEARLSSGQPCGERFGGSGEPLPESDAVIFNAAYLARFRGLTGLGTVTGLDTLDPAQASLAGAILDGLVLKSFEVAEYRWRNPWT